MRITRTTASGEISGRSGSDGRASAGRALLAVVIGVW